MSALNGALDGVYTYTAGAVYMADSSPVRSPFDSLGVTSPLPEDLAAARARDENEAAEQRTSLEAAKLQAAEALALRVEQFAAMFGGGLTHEQIESVVKRGEDDDKTHAILRDMAERRRATRKYTRGRFRL